MTDISTNSLAQIQSMIDSSLANSISQLSTQIKIDIREEIYKDLVQPLQDKLNAQDTLIASQSNRLVTLEEDLEQLRSGYSTLGNKIDSSNRNLEACCNMLEEEMKETDEELRASVEQVKDSVIQQGKAANLICKVLNSDVIPEVQSARQAYFEGVLRKAYQHVKVHYVTKHSNYQQKPYYRVVLTQPYQRSQVLKNKRELRGTNVFIDIDLSPSQYKTRQSLFQAFTAEYQHLDVNTRPKFNFVGDRMFVNGRRFLGQRNNTPNQGSQPTNQNMETT